MVNQQTLQGRWTEITGKLREKWGQLSDQDLQTFRGDAEQLVGYIQRKTGESREAIEKYLDQLAAGGSQAAESARKYMHEAGDRFRDFSEQMTENVRHGYENAETMVSERPLESVGVAFGIGLIAGVLVGILLRGR